MPMMKKALAAAAKFLYFFSATVIFVLSFISRDRSIVLLFILCIMTARVTLCVLVVVVCVLAVSGDANMCVLCVSG